MNIDDILDIVTENAVITFKNSYVAQGYVPRGAVYDSIRRNKHSVEASIAVATLIYGRRPGKYPPWGYEQKSNNRTALMKWAQDKLGVDEKAAKSISFLIARKLKLYGNDVYRKLKAPIDTTPAREVAIQTMQELILNNHKKLINNGK